MGTEGQPKQLMATVCVAILVAIAFVAAYSGQTTSGNESSSTSKSEEAKETRRVANWTETLALLTAILATVSAAQIYFLFRADKTASENANAAKRSAEAAMEAVKVAQGQLALAQEAAETPLRAYIAIGDIAYANGYFSVEVVNKGATPANDVELLAERTWHVPGTEFITHSRSLTGFPSGFQIAPNSSEVVRLDDPEVRTLRSAVSKVQVTVYYLDWFSKKRTCSLNFSYQGEEISNKQYTTG